MCIQHEVLKRFHFNSSLSARVQCRSKEKLKSKKDACLNTDKVLVWNIAKTLGTQNARIMTSKSTSSLEVKSCPFAGDVGVNWQRKTWSGENVERFGMNTARSLLGKNVNLHLKDGSVIVNVLLSRIDKDEYQRRAFVECIPYGYRNTFKIPLKSVAWAELLNLIMIGG
jgi:hypothetical protein